MISKREEFEIIDQINNELQLRSFRISEADYKKLLRTQNKICIDLDWIELNQDKISEIINLFLSSSYLNEYSYMMILQQVIMQYYQFRSQYSWHVADDYLMKMIYQVFVACGGTFENNFKSKLIQILKESEYMDGE